MEQQIRLRKIQQRFRMRGFSLSVDALKEVALFLDDCPSTEDDAVERLLEEVDRISVKSNVLSKEAVLNIIAAITGCSNDGHNALRVINAFDMRRFCYDPIRKVFYLFTDNLTLHGDAQSKASLYRDRLQLLQQRVVRDKHFARPVFEIDGSANGACEMTSVQSLIGCRGKRWVMGVVSQLEDGRFYLEDLSAAVPVDFSSAKITSGFLTENSVILAEGVLQPNGTFLIETCGFPPLESRDVSLGVTAGLDFFGGGVTSQEEVIRLEQLESNAVNDMFIIISDVWLDNEETMEKLATVLSGYESVDVVPSVFIFLGNFCSHSCNLAFHNFAQLRSQFRKLGALIASYPRIKEASQFIFIPGPDDPGPSNVLPRPPLPKFFADEFMKQVPNAIFSSNPCRILFYSQEMVLFREDLLYRMRRSCIVPPSEEETNDPFSHLITTVTHQSHLCPLPLTTQPISWNYDHALRLYPSPHTIVLADRSEQRMAQYTGITCFNPGSFSIDGTFVAYRPATREPELSAV